MLAGAPFFAKNLSRACLRGDITGNVQPSAVKRVSISAVATAACLILLFTVALWFDHSPNSIATATVTTQKDSYDNPEEAAAEAELVLMKFSQVINKATCYNTK